MYAVIGFMQRDFKNIASIIKYKGILKLKNDNKGEVELIYYETGPLNPIQVTLKCVMLNKIQTSIVYVYTIIGIQSHELM